MMTVFYSTDTTDKSALAQLMSLCRPGALTLAVPMMTQGLRAVRQRQVAMCLVTVSAVTPGGLGNPLR